MTTNNLSNLQLYPGSGSVCARVVGPINRLTIPNLQQQVEGVLRDRGACLTIDLGGAEYLDSDGIRWLQQVDALVSAGNGELRLAVREGSRIDRTLRLLQLEKVFQVDLYQAEPGDPGSSSAYQFSVA
jgi:anti-anti-sigma factor